MPKLNEVKCVFQITPIEAHIDKPLVNNIFLFIFLPFNVVLIASFPCLCTETNHAQDPPPPFIARAH